jgi:hypothetical protein
MPRSLVVAAAYINVMSQPPTPDPIFDAVDALMDAGHVVQPWEDDLGMWLVNGETLTDQAVVALAARLGLMEAPSPRVQ